MDLYFLSLVWIIYEQVMIAALDCSRDDLAIVSLQIIHWFCDIIGYILDDYHFIVWWYQLHTI